MFKSDIIVNAYMAKRPEAKQSDAYAFLLGLVSSTLTDKQLEEILKIIKHIQ